ncbi:MAG: hypothetical protein R2758_16840 [Bacteroidales bacterium]
MKRIRINTPEGKSILLMGGTVRDILPLLPRKGLFIITDTNVRKIYGTIFPPGEVLTIEPGEKSKTLAVAGELCRQMLEAGADRTSFVLGFGGGVVCDVAGLVASIYMRGVRHAFISTLSFHRSMPALEARPESTSANTRTFSVHSVSRSLYCVIMKC